MSRQESFRNKKKTSDSKMWTLAIVLLFCVLLTTYLAWTAMGLFSKVREPDQVVSLLPSDSEGEGQGEGGQGGEGQTTGDTSGQAGELQSSFYVSDDKQVWGKQTKVDIFRVSYENGAGVITAASGNGDKIVAPGTSNDYQFRLTNDGERALDYEMRVTATLSDNLKGYTVPVQVRLSDETGAWLCGNADTWRNFVALDGTNKKGILGKNCYTAYTLEWDWPYESGDDAFDTMLGNLAVDEDLVLTICINITAEEDPDPEAIGGTPQTGDNSYAVLWVFLLFLSIGGLILVFVCEKRRTKDSEE